MNPAPEKQADGSRPALSNDALLAFVPVLALLMVIWLIAR